MRGKKLKWLLYTRFLRCLDLLLCVRDRVNKCGFYRSPRIVTPANVAIGLCLATLLSGCAVNTFIPSQSFERIEIIALGSETQTDVPSKGKSTATGAAAGAVGGLTASVLGSLICGPYFAVCFMAIAPATIGTTMLVVGAMGMSGISDEDVAIIKPHLETLHANRNMNQELATLLAEKFPLSSLAPPGVADARISLDVNSLRLTKAFGRKLEFSLTVVAQYEWHLNRPNPLHSSRKFMCRTRLQPIDKWANDEGATIGQELTACIEDLARQINKVLTDPPPLSADEFSEFDV